MMDPLYQIHKGLRRCPYNTSHTVPARRFIRHLLKCARKSRFELMVCPWNATHHVYQEDYAKHVCTCEAQQYLDSLTLNPYQHYNWTFDSSNSNTVPAGFQSRTDCVPSLEVGGDEAKIFEANQTTSENRSSYKKYGFHSKSQESLDLNVNDPVVNNNKTPFNHKNQGHVRSRLELSEDGESGQDESTESSVTGSSSIDIGSGNFPVFEEYLRRLEKYRTQGSHVQGQFSDAETLIEDVSRLAFNPGIEVHKTRTQVSASSVWVGGGDLKTIKVSSRGRGRGGLHDDKYLFSPEPVLLQVNSKQLEGCSAVDAVVSTACCPKLDDCKPLNKTETIPPNKAAIAGPNMKQGEDLSHVDQPEQYLLAPPACLSKLGNDSV